jgi:hypothetical protein
MLCVMALLFVPPSATKKNTFFFGLAPDHDVEFLQLDVDGVVVLDEEDLHLVLEDVGSLLDDQVDVPEGDVLNLRLGGEQRHQRRGQLLAQVRHKIGVLVKDHPILMST